MNYTNPNDTEHKDSPQDWLSGALIFGRALSVMFVDREGIVVDLKGDMVFPPNETVKKVIVYKNGGQVQMIECEDDLEEGTPIMMHGVDEN